MKHPSAEEFELARDSYDDCIAYMDDQIGNLLGALDARGLLSNTLVIVTSDHGEAFGEHGIYCHFATVHRSEIDVPLLVSFRGRIPEGKRIADPVSIRNLPATVLDLLNLNDRSPFPGRSLARLWGGGSGPDKTGPNGDDDLVLSELEEMSVQAIMSGTMVYIRHEDGEQLFDLKYDPGEDNNLMGYPGRRPDAQPFRSRLARVCPIAPAVQ
jgi:arylsulfatase A-like enzyme